MRTALILLVGLAGCGSAGGGSQPTGDAAVFVDLASRLTCPSVKLEKCPQNQMGRPTIDFCVNPAHCGGCFQACTVPNAVPMCAYGRCVIGACNLGFLDCNQRAEDGCESSVCSPPADMSLPDGAAGD